MQNLAVTRALIKCPKQLQEGYCSTVICSEEKAFVHICFAIVSNIWPLAGPNIAEKEAALVERAKLSSRDQVGC